jgi:signal transduction histidine kinase/putative methionine-R-sulfoxide reductase with GAF domain
MIMFTRIRHFLAAPVFEDEDKTRVAGLLNTILLAVLPLSVVYGIGSLFIYPDPVPVLASIGAVILLGLGALSLMRSGRVQLASVSLSFALWGIVTFGVFFFGGVRGPSFSGYFVVILIVGLLLGGRAGIAFAGLSVVAGLGILCAEIKGVLPPSPIAITPASTWTLVTAMLILAAVLLYLATHSTNDAFKRARRNERDLLAEIAERKRAEEALKTFVRQHAALFQLSADLAIARDEADVCREVVRGLHDTLVYDYLRLFLVDEGTGERVLRASIGWPDAPSNWRIPPGHGLSERPLLDGRLHYTPDVTCDPRYVPGLNSGTEVDVPLRIGDKVLGVLAVESSQPNAFDQDDFAVLTAAANQAAIAIENAQLHAETRRQLQEQIALREAGAVITSTLDLADVLSRIAQQMGQAVDVTSTYISGNEPGTMAYTVLAEYIGPQACAREQVSDLGATYLEDDIEFLEIMEAGQHDISHIDDPDLSESERAHMQQYGAQTMLYIPLRIKGRLVGFTELWESRRRREFTSEEIALCQGIAQQAAIALENARLYEQAQQEISERKQAEEQLQRYAAELEQANEELKRFTYVASHNLRAPLVNLRGFAAELRAALAVIGSAVIAALPHLDEKRRPAVTMALQEDIPEALGFIDSSVTLMDRLVNALLELSRLNRGELRLEPVDMNALVQETLQALAHQIEQRQVSVTVGSLPTVVADRASMQQIMGNLLNNAVIYLDPVRPGEIEITGERDHDETTFRVRDNGCGIAEEDMDKVFAPFRRAGRQDVPGEGMGLAYVQALVRRHGGRIWCESEPGVGTTFTFTLSNHLEKGGDHV